MKRSFKEAFGSENSPLQPNQLFPTTPAAQGVAAPAPFGGFNTPHNNNAGQLTLGHAAPGISPVGGAWISQPIAQENAGQIVVEAPGFSPVVQPWLFPTTPNVVAPHTPGAPIINAPEGLNLAVSFGSPVPSPLAPFNIANQDVVITPGSVSSAMSIDSLTYSPDSDASSPLLGLNIQTPFVVSPLDEDLYQTLEGIAGTPMSAVIASTMTANTQVNPWGGLPHASTTIQGTNLSDAFSEEGTSVETLSDDDKKPTVEESDAVVASNKMEVSGEDDLDLSYLDNIFS